MDLDKVIKVLEQYARDYIHYILSFFGSLEEPAPATADGGGASLDDGKLLIFGFFNALVGAALQGLFVKNLTFKDINFPQAVIVEVCYWLLLTLIFDFILAVGTRRPAFSEALSLILRVVPVAYVVGAYTAFVIYFVALAFTKPDRATWWASFAFAAVQLLLLILLLRHTTRGLAEHSPLRRVVASSAIVTVVLVVNVTVLLVTQPFSGKKQPPGTTPAVAAAGRVAALFIAGVLAVGLLSPGQAFAQAPPAPPAAGAPAPADPEPDCALDGGELFACAFHKGHQLVDDFGSWISKHTGGGGSAAPPTAPPPPAHHDNRTFALTTPAADRDLNAADLAAIEQAAAYAKSNGGRIKIELAGDPADAEGADAYRRAEAIRQKLYGRGIAPEILFEVHPTEAGDAMRVTQIDVFF